LEFVELCGSTVVGDVAFIEVVVVVVVNDAAELHLLELAADSERPAGLSRLSSDAVGDGEDIESEDELPFY